MYGPVSIRLRCTMAFRQHGPTAVSQTLQRVSLECLGRVDLCMQMCPVGITSTFMGCKMYSCGSCLMVVIERSTKLVRPKVTHCSAGSYVISDIQTGADSVPYWKSNNAYLDVTVSPS